VCYNGSGGKMKSEALSTQEAEQSVQILMQRSRGISKEHAEVILDVASNDLNKALEILDSLSDRSISIIKVRFASENMHQYGLLLIILNVLKGILEKVNVVAVRNPMVCLFDVKASWDSIEKVINGIKSRKLGVEDYLTKKIQVRLKEVFGRVDKESFQLLIDRDEEGFKEILKDELVKLVEDPTLKMWMCIDWISALEEKTTTKAPEKELSHDEEIKSKEKGIWLNIAPVIAPVSGVSIEELEVGDRIIIKIVEESELGRFLAELMGGRVGEQIVPLMVPIKEIFPLDDGKLQVIVKFGPGVFGKGIVPQDLKVFSAAQLLRKEEKFSFQKNSSLLLGISLGVIGMLNVTILTLLLLLFFR
jgi:hypothetical protein